MRNNLFFYTLIALLICACSKDDDTPIDDPDKAILGRWELVESGNGIDLYPINQPVEYEEYLADSIMRFYNYDKKEYDDQKYYITDSLLTKKLTFYDSNNGDTLELEEPYKYDFLDRDRLRLNFQYPAVQRIFIYKRLK